MLNESELKIIRDLCFVVESFAHLQGKEEFLPYAEAGRQLVRWHSPVPIDQLIKEEMNRGQK